MTSGFCVASRSIRFYLGERRAQAARWIVTADVIDVSPETLNLEVILAKFNREHWHNEDEVRFIIRGLGLFHPTPYISRYFDTTTGSKTDSHSYQEIAKILQRLPSEMVFISDCHSRA